jgi:DnaJ-class molecular chaperone
MSLPLDYYSILGVSRSCSSSDLRSAYRSFSLLSHPNASTSQEEKQRFAEQFRLVSEAFHVLSNPDTRALFDQFGEVGLKSGIPLVTGSSSSPYKFTQDPEQLFLEQFGHNSPFFELFRPKESPLSGIHTPIASFTPELQKAKPQEINVYLDLEEFYSKAAKKVKILRNRQIQEEAGGVYKVEERYINIEVGDGWKDGTRLTFPGEGDQEAGKATGDLILIVKEKPHPVYQKRGAHLIYTVEISLLEALTGCSVNLTTLDGRKLAIPVNEIVSPSYEKLISNEGFTKKGGKERGNLIIQFRVRYPEELSLEQKNGLKRLLAGK